MSHVSPRSTLLALLAVATVLVPVLARAEGVPEPPPVPKLGDEQRLPWSRGDLWFLKTWLVAGPFPGTLAADALLEHGGEAAIRPTPDLTHALPGGARVSWKSFSSWSDAVSLDEAMGASPDATGVAYAFTTLKRAEAGQALISLGSDDGVRVFLNGALVHEHLGRRPLVLDEDRVLVPMLAGENAILVKVEQRRGPWSFALRVLEPGTELALATELGPALEDENVVAGSLSVRTDRHGPRMGAAVTVEVVAPGGQVIASQSNRRGESLRFDTRAWADGPYEVRFLTTTSAGRPWATHLPWFKGDVRAAARRVLETAKTADASTSAGMIRKMLGDLVLDRVGGDLEKAGSLALDRAHPVLMEAAELDLEAAGKTGRRRGYGFVRLAWRDEVDGSVQFCRAYLPAGYDPARRWPLVANLHGYNPANPVYVRWWAVADRHHALLAEDRGADAPILIEPMGRGNTSYRGMGEKDVLRAIAEAKALLSVDEDRVYLMGDSMGGWGTWQVATRHPQLFAAIAPIFGGADYRSQLDEAVLRKLRPAERLLFEKRSSFAQAESLRNVPIFIHHGDSDKTVNVEFSRWIVRMLQRWGYDVRYRELPGRGHEDMKIHAETIDWLLEHRRVASPRQVRVRSAELGSAAAHWLSLDRAQDAAAFLEAEAELIGPNRIRLDTRNVAAATLTPGPLVDASRPVEVVWNGVSHSVSPLQGRLELRAEAASTGARVKDRTLAGPFRELTSTPFAVVVGTIASDQAMRAMCAAKARAFVQAWQAWQHVTPRVFEDTVISDADAARHSLLLVGGPADNALAKRLASRIPLEVRKDAVVIDGTSFAVEDGLVGLVTPSPLNPERYVAVVAGTSVGGLWFWNPSDDSAFDWDFFVVDGRSGGATALAQPGFFPERGRVVSGLFDGDWRYSEASTLRGDAELRAKATAVAPPRPAKVDPAVFDRLAGSYQIGPGVKVLVKREGDQLLATQDANPPVQLLPESETSYFILQQDLRLVFELGQDGRATGVVVKLPGQDVRGSRIE
jgi:poly(3-hydroxybutyrate) depolymerase